ncbi:biotin--[acetyl-CoA-carboxylase] ligase [Brotaphodocola sp.]|uniref:biotin--[acetyl-CoA-carboxylase] ligase n=1 Tax=Brotaphodocola sp. TaxID=3073577 RepID=UPI003D7CEDD2
MKTEILTCLKETDGYVSGQELCDRLGVSRTAIWKVIGQLREEGYDIEAVRSRGYRLCGAGDVLSEAEIASVLETERLGRNIRFLDVIESTNNEIRRMAENGAPDGTLAIAEIQTAGKGRRGRSWTSPRGSGIWMSFLLRPEFAPEYASMLTLVTAMAVEKAVREETGLDCQIKWPNDIVVNGRKICGILTEMSTEEDSIRYVVVGIGINVNTREFPEEIRKTATSIAIECGHPVRRAPLAAAVLKAWEEFYETFKKTLDLSLLKEEYNSRLVNMGREVKVLAPKGDYIGTSYGITDTGELIVETDGQRREVMSGEVSVRGVYGYV